MLERVPCSVIHSGVCVCVLTSRRYVQAELVHGRTAMTGVAGILIPGVST